MLKIDAELRMTDVMCPGDGCGAFWVFVAAVDDIYVFILKKYVN